MAVAVAVPGKKARLIEPDNTAVETIGLHRAVDSGQAFLVALRDDIVAFDFDDTVHAPLIAEVARAIRAAGCLPVIWNSGSPDHQHVLGRVGSEERARIEALVAERSGTRQIARRAIRPPLSPHRLGLPVSLTEPTNVNEAALRLRAPNLDDLAKTDTSRLSRKMGRLLRTGEKEAGDGSPSGVMQSLLVAMVNAHWSRDHAYNVLAKPENKGGAALQQRLADEGDRAADRWFDHCWQRAEVFVRDNPAWRDRSEVVEALADAKAAVDLAQWDGADGHKIRAALGAVMDIALGRGSVEVQISVRQIAEGAGLSKDGVMKKYLPTLQHMGFLTKIKKHQGVAGTTYRINLTAIRSLPLSIYPAGREIFGRQLSVGHDAFRHGGGLGKAGHAILEALIESGTASDVAERTGIPAPTVRRLLRALETGGLATAQAGVWSRLEPLEALLGALDVFAYEAGVADAGVRQKEFHAYERAHRDAARSGQSLPDRKIPAKRGYAAITGRGFWPLGKPVRVDDLRGDGLIGPLLLTVVQGPQDAPRRGLLSHRKLIEVRQVSDPG